jgi:hypothetical protein
LFPHAAAVDDMPDIGEDNIKQQRFLFWRGHPFMYTSCTVLDFCTFRLISVNEIDLTTRSSW